MSLPAAPPLPVLAHLPAVLETVRPELEVLEERLRANTGLYQPALRQLLEWVFSSGGKRIRPAIVFAAARLGRADPAVLTNMAAGIETLHTATLVHDDLVDGSLVRRGLPTLNTRWNAGATVLAGDWLFARAARFTAETENIRVVQIFARTLATMTDGELQQLLGRSGVPDREQYDFRIYAKTASLFEAATESVGVLLGVPEPQVNALARYGCELGKAFQIADDILDFTGDPAHLGKPVGGDLRSGTVTLPVLLHLAAHPSAAPWLDAGAEPTTDEVDLLIEAVRADRVALDAAHAAAAAHKDRAVAALGVFPPGPARTNLERIAAFIVARDV